MDSHRNPALLSELRYALAVIEERSHLGLDEESTSRVRRILLQQIAKVESALASRPAHAQSSESEVLAK